MDLGHVFSHTGSDQVILNPFIRALDFALGLGRQSEDHVNTTVAQDLLPLGIHVIGLEDVSAVKGVPALDEPEDGVGVHVIGVGQAVLEKYRLKSLNMSPGSFLL